MLCSETINQIVYMNYLNIYSLFVPRLHRSTFASHQLLNEGLPDNYFCNSRLSSLSELNASLAPEPECSPNEWYDLTRYALITYVGTPIALTGVVCNLILLVIIQ